MFKSLSKFLLIIAVSCLTFLSVACGEDKEISSGHYQGQNGGTYTLSRSGNKEYYGNNSYGLNLGSSGVVIIIILIVILVIFGLIAYLIYQYRKDIYVDPKAIYTFCSNYNCTNMFARRNNRKYCQNHSSSKARVNINKKVLIAKEEKMTKMLFSEKRYINNILSSESYSSKQSFVWYLHSKKEVDLKKENNLAEDRDKFYKKYKDLYFNGFIRSKYKVKI